jgi:heme-degrading monooxygenase HmoA
MEIVLLDMFVVPDESKSALLETSRSVQDVIKTLPGFVEGYVYEKRVGDGRHTIVTTTVWKDESAFERARSAVPEQLRALGINLVEKMKELKVEIERGVYTRAPY